MHKYLGAHVYTGICIHVLTYRHKYTYIHKRKKGRLVFIELMTLLESFCDSLLWNHLQQEEQTTSVLQASFYYLRAIEVTDLRSPFPFLSYGNTRLLLHTPEPRWEKTFYRRLAASLWSKASLTQLKTHWHFLIFYLWSLLPWDVEIPLRRHLEIALHQKPSDIIL